MQLSQIYSKGATVVVQVNGARGAVGLDLEGPVVPGQYVAFTAERKAQGSAGTGADAGLRTDLAAPGGAANVGLQRTGGPVVAGRSVRTKLDETASVKDFGAKGDDATDDRAAIQAAFNSGAKCVIFPRGKYVISGPLNVPNWLHVVGEAYQAGIGVGDGAVVLKFTANVGNQLVCGFRPLFEGIVFYNSAAGFDANTGLVTGTTATCIKLADDMTCERCSFQLWDTAIRTGASSFYTRTDEVEFNRCNVGYRAEPGAAPDGPCDLDIRSPISRLTRIFFLGDAAKPARDLKISGGSIEGYQQVISGGCLDVTFTHVYFETVAEREGAFAIDPDTNGASVALFGCTIYMNHTARFVNMSARPGSLTSVGNRYTGVGPANGICLYLPAAGNVILAGDDFGAGHPASLRYVDSLGSAAKFNNIVFPQIPAGNDLAAVSGLALIGQRGFLGIGLAAAPVGPITGLSVMADGDAWDPLARAAGRPYWTVWQGDRWRAMDGGA